MDQSSQGGREKGPTRQHTRLKVVARRQPEAATVTQVPRSLGVDDCPPLFDFFFDFPGFPFEPLSTNRTSSLYLFASTIPTLHTMEESGPTNLAQVGSFPRSKR